MVHLLDATAVVAAVPVVVTALAKSRLLRQINSGNGGKDEDMGPEECDFRSGLLAG